MLAGIKFVDKSQADKDLEEERKLLKKQKKKLKKVSQPLATRLCLMPLATCAILALAALSLC